MTEIASAKPAAPTAPVAQEHLIPTPRGRLFARSWTPPASEERAGGGGVPILLFHDSLGCVALWRSFPERLAAATGRRVIAYDRLGFGRSDPYPGLLPIDFVAAEAREAVPAICDALCINGFIACGHSVGGGMGIHTAAALPERCRALVTIAAQAFVEDRTIAGIEVAKAGFQRPEDLARLARYHGDKARWVVDAWTETWLSPVFADWTVDAARARVRCPVLAIHGELDEYGSTEHPRRIAGTTGTARILAGIGHVPHRECEGDLVELISGFLAGAVPAAD